MSKRQNILPRVVALRAFSNILDYLGCKVYWINMICGQYVDPIDILQVKSRHLSISKLYYLAFE